MIEWKIERRRQIRERSPPVRQLARQCARGIAGASEHTPLPDGIVRILDGQFGKRRRRAPAAGVVGVREIALEHAERPPVGRKVVHDDQEHEDLLVGDEQLGAIGQLAHEVEALAHRGAHRVHHRGRRDRDNRQRTLRGVGREDLLARLALGLRDDRAQAFVPSHDVLHCGLERIDVRGLCESPFKRHVIRRARRFQCVEEPETVLRIRKGNDGGTRTARERRSGLPRRRQPCCEPGDRPSVEQMFERHEGAAHAADQAHREQRLTSEHEEVIVDANARDVEDVAEQRAEDLLGGRSRGPIRLERRFRLGQRAAVDLAGHGARQVLEVGDDRRHHVVRHQLGELCPRARARCGARHVCGEPQLALRCGPGHHHRVAHTLHLQQRLLHGPELQAEAADLHLRIGATRKAQRAIGAPLCAVAGAIQPAARSAVRIGHERRRGDAWPAQIPARQPHPRDEELAGHANRRRRVEDVKLRVAERPAQRRATALVAARQNRVGADDRRFRRSIVDVRDDAIADGVHRPQHRRRNHVAAG